jgi:flagellar hook-associated protein 3 FlgL
MRISTNLIYDMGISAVQKLQSSLMHTQEQISSGRRILNPSDDPVGAARVLDATQSLAINEQFRANLTYVKSSLSLEEAALEGVTNALQDVKTLAIYAGNPTLTDANRSSLAEDLRGKFNELLGLANRTGGDGTYIFAGYKGSTLPFVETTTGATYNGDQGHRVAQIDSSRQIAVGDSGFDVFEKIKTGNGTFTTAAAGGNTGTGVVGAGMVVDLAKWRASAMDYKIVFVTPTTYDIQDAGGASLIGGVPRTYTPGASINLKSQGLEPPFDLGASLTITGSPAAGDVFTVKASTNQSLFTTLKQLMNLLSNPVTDKTAYQNGLNAAISSLDNALNNVLTIRGGVGSRLKEVDAVEANGENMSLLYTQLVSDLQDLDYAKAISDLDRQQMQLQAAQKSYLNVTNLSLFNYINPGR